MLKYYKIYKIDLQIDYVAMNMISGFQKIINKFLKSKLLFLWLMTQIYKYFIIKVVISLISLIFLLF